MARSASAWAEMCLPNVPAFSITTERPAPGATSSPAE